MLILEKIDVMLKGETMKKNKKESILKKMNKYKLDDGTVFYADNDKDAQLYKNHVKKVKGE